MSLSEHDALLIARLRGLPEPQRAIELERAMAEDPTLRDRRPAIMSALAAAAAPAPAGASGLETPAAMMQAFQTALEVAPTEAPGKRIGAYTLLQKIGEGGFSTVWLADQTEPIQRKVAVKIIKLGMDTEEVIARFEAERQALALQDHPNIARVFDAGSTDTGRPYFVMELVRGVAITRYCDENQLPAEARLRLFMAVCQAVQHAHQKGVLHRDLKPSNILVTLYDGVPVPKVIDFGIAKATGVHLTARTFITQFHAFLGTPAYSSPEQMEMSALDVDTRSDIYSLGVLLYELLCGRLPFDADTLAKSGLEAMRRMIREIDPPRPSHRLDTLSQAERTTMARQRGTDASKLSLLLRGDLDWIVMRCLEKDRQRRYATATGLAADIERHLNNQAVLARPPTAWYRLQKLIRRHRLIFAAASAVIMALVAGLGFSTWSFFREAAQRRIAVEQRTKAERAQENERQERLRAETEKATAQRLLYIANMNLVQQAAESGAYITNYDRVWQLLDETREFPDRGFEWYYWQLKIHRSIQWFLGHSGPVRSVAYSPDGSRIVTGSWDKTAKVWDVATVRELLTLKGHADQISGVAYSPDGRRIATGSYDHLARVWDAVDGRILLTLSGHSQNVNDVAFSPDGRRIVTGSWDKTAKVWDAGDGRELLTLKGHGAMIYKVAFSPDGSRIVTGSDDRSARVWDAATGRELLVFQEESVRIFAVAFSPDGRHIISSGINQAALSWETKVWEADSGRVLHTLRGHRNVVLALAYSPDGRRIVTGSSDHTAKVWDAATGRELFTLKGQGSVIHSVAFSPDGRWIVTGSMNGLTQIWNATDNYQLQSFEGHQDAIRSAAISPDGQRIVTASEDHTARVWDTATGRELLTFREHRAPVNAVAFSPDGHEIVTGSTDQTAKIWEVSTGRVLRTLEGHRASLWSVAFSPDGQRIVTGSIDRTARVWDIATGRELLTLRGLFAGPGTAIYSPDGRRIVTSGIHQSADQGEANVWDATTGQMLLTLKGHGIMINGVAFSPDGRRIVTGSGDGTAKVWDAVTGQDLLTLKGHNGIVTKVAFSPDGRRIVTGGGGDKTARVWDAVTGRELLNLDGHPDTVWAVAFSPDGRSILTGCYDQTVRLWRAAGDDQVAAWQAEEQSAKKFMMAFQRERQPQGDRQAIPFAQDEGAIKRWLVLAPIPFAPNQTVTEALESEQISGEARLRPKAGDKFALSDGDFRWQEIELVDYKFSFSKIVLWGRISKSVAYAVCYIHADTAQRGLRMLVGSDDQSKIYLNGQLILKSPVMPWFAPDQITVPDVALNAGLNVLVFKVVNDIQVWAGSVRLTDAQGQPLKGIKVVLAPGDSDRGSVLDEAKLTQPAHE